MEITFLNIVLVVVAVWVTWYIIIPFSLFATFVTIGFAKIWRRLYKQSKCEHVEYKENYACHAICRKCDKDLGFIANLRETNPAGEVHTEWSRSNEPARLRGKY